MVGVYALGEEVACFYFPHLSGVQLLPPGAEFGLMSIISWAGVLPSFKHGLLTRLPEDSIAILEAAWVLEGSGENRFPQRGW